MNREKLYEYRADFLLLSVAISWGVTFLMVQEAIKTTPVYSFLFFRFAIATIIMFFISYKFLKELTFKTIFYAFILATFLFSAFATQTFGLADSKSSIIAFLTGLNVIFVPFLAFFIFKDKIRRNVLLASIIAVFGLYLLTMSGTLVFARGELLGVVCGVLFALHIVFTGKYSVKTNVFLLVFVQFFFVSLYSLCFSFIFDETTFDIEFNYSFYKAVIVTAVFATVYAFLIQTYMQQFTTATKTAIIFTMEPVSAAVFGYFAASEILTNIQILGASLIILATLLAEIQFKQVAKKNKLN